MKDFQKRMVEEFKELNTKRNKLIEFIHTDSFMVLPLEHRFLLVQQEQTMVLYSNILKRRLELMGIDAFNELCDE